MPPFSSDPCLFRRRRKEARPAELLEAALTLFVEKGFAATRSEEVAKAAGVSKGTLYLYFPSKEELLKAVIQHFLGTEIETGIQEAAAADGPTAEVMEQLAGHLVDAHLRRPGVGRLQAGDHRGAQLSRDRRVLGRARRRPGPRDRLGPAAARHRPRRVRGRRRRFGRPLHPDAADPECVHKHSFMACGIGKEMDIDPVVFMHAHLRLIFAGLQARPPRPTRPAAGRPASPHRI